MDSEATLSHVPIDWRLSIELANHNKDLAKELLAMFMMDLPVTSAAIQTSFKEEEYERLGDQVHRLHGASSYCGVTQLKLILTEMECAIREKRFEQVAANLIVFNQEVNNILSAYQTMEFV